MESLKQGYFLIGRQEMCRACLLGQGEEPQQQDLMNKVLLGKQSMLWVQDISAQQLKGHIVDWEPDSATSQLHDLGQGNLTSETLFADVKNRGNNMCPCKVF